MVRSKPKKQKGDEAFTTRKQKVGRKKLAPVTTTRAEVHARTLHIATSTAMAKATAAEAAAEPSNNNNNNKNNNNNNSKAIQVLNYSELLSGAQHYKSANRSSALTTMSRLLLMQEEVDLKALAAGDMFSGFIALPSSTRKPQPTAPAGAGSSSSGLTGVSPLEKLKSFAAALEAMTDTDNDARKAALQCVKIIIRHQWLSSSQTAHTTRETAAVQQMIARETGNAEEMLSMMGSSVVEREHTRAVLQAVHVCLTHALKSVRMSGVELLGLLLTYAPAGAVRRAARDVCHQQRTYLAFSLDDDDVKSSNAKKTHGDMQSLAAKEEEEWMLTLARRVSALVMKTPHMWVLPELLAAFWMDTTNNDNSSVDNASINHSGLFSSSSSSSQVGVFHYGASKNWRHPLLVQAFFDDVLPQWSNAWKELQELRLTLFRHEDKLLCAIALGRSFALVLTFLKQKQMEEQQRCMMAGEEGGAVRKASVASQLFLSRNKQQLIKNLFIHRVPVTMEEILLGSSSSSSSSNASRLEFALVLAQVCGPLAGSDDGWKVLHHYFNGMFPKTSSNSTAAPQLSAGALLQSLQLFLIVLRMFPRSVHTPRLHGEAAADHHSSNHGVTEKLITFVPGILRSVIQHVGICADAAASSAARASSSADDAVLMQVLLVTAQIVDCVSQYPLPSEYKADNRQRSVAVALEMSFSLVPRLLFALRLHYKTAAIAKPSEEQGNTGMDNEEEEGTSQLAVTSVSSHGVLQQHPLLVDMVVAAFLRTYWFIASSGHPLLLQANNNNNSSNSDGNKDAGNAFRQTLRQSLSSLFGLSMGSQAVEGVLARCTERTAEVARHVMFYLPSGADTQQQQHLRVVRQGEGAAARDEEGEEVFAWGDLLSALPCVFS